MEWNGMEWNGMRMQMRMEWNTNDEGLTLETPPFESP